MSRLLFPALLVFTLVACQQMLQSGDPAAVRSSVTLMQAAGAGASASAQRSPYAAAIVKDLETADAELGAVFGAAFRETLQREGYVRVALPDESGADVMIIQSATMRVSPSELEIAVAVRDARGRLLDWYAVHYSSGSLPGKDGRRRMFADAGQQVARAIARAR